MQGYRLYCVVERNTNRKGINMYELDEMHAATIRSALINRIDFCTATVKEYDFDRSTVDYFEAEKAMALSALDTMHAQRP